MPTTPARPTSSPSRGLDRSELARRYAAYRRRQAYRLVGMLPREAVRPLYRRACAEREPAGTDDPLGLLAEYCEALLPLPPFEVWRRDVSAHPDAHLRDLDESAEAPTAEAPATLEARTFTHAESRWSARLRTFRDGSVWKGFIEFTERAADRVHRTAVIFNEIGPVDLRERFLSFDDRALEAFLRSALP